MSRKTCLEPRRAPLKGKPVCRLVALANGASSVGFRAFSRAKPHSANHDRLEPVAKGTVHVGATPRDSALVEGTWIGMMNGGCDGGGGRFTIVRGLLVAVISCTALASESAAALPGDYALTGTTTLPSGMWDIGPDGRIFGLDGLTIVRQNDVGGAAYSPIGSVSPGTISTFGASFFSISPSGTTIAIGDNESGGTARVHFVSLGALNTSGPTQTISTPSLNFAAAWSSETEVYVVGGSFGGANGVNRITLSGSAASAIEEIRGIPEAVGGVGVNAGRVFAGVGFGARTGEVRSFDLAALQATAPPAAADFDSGLLHGTFLSAGSLDFDDSSNLIVAGQSGVIITDLNGASVILSPLGHGAFYNAAYNPLTREIVVQATDFVSGGSGVFVYGVPAPSSMGLLLMVATIRHRRRRAS